MKRLFLTFTLIAVLAGVFSLPALAQEQQEILVRIDGLKVTFDVQPVIRNGRTLVPFRAIAEALNVEVNWDGTTQTVSAAHGKTTVRLQIGSKTAYCNQSTIILDVPPQFLNGRTLIPLRFFSEAFNCKVEWNNGVMITSPHKDMTVAGFYALGDSNTSSWTNLFGKAYPEHTLGNTDVVNELALGWYAVDAEGNLLTRSRTGWQRPSGWESVLSTAEGYGIRTEMVVHEVNRESMLNKLLENDEAVKHAVEGITAEAAQYYSGVNLNLEGLGLSETGEQLIQVQNSFTRLAAQLSESLHSRGLTLTLTIHAPNSAYKGYDYTALGRAADRIIIMAYDYGAKPEPDSLVIQAVEQALKHIPEEKLVLGVSIPSETPESILTKVGIAKRYKLNGIALWRLGLLTDEMWNVLRKS